MDKHEKIWTVTQLSSRLCHEYNKPMTEADIKSINKTIKNSMIKSIINKDYKEFYHKVYK